MRVLEIGRTAVLYIRHFADLGTVERDEHVRRGTEGNGLLKAHLQHIDLWCKPSHRVGHLQTTVVYGFSLLGSTSASVDMMDTPYISLAVIALLYLSTLSTKCCTASLPLL